MFASFDAYDASSSLVHTIKIKREPIKTTPKFESRIGSRASGTVRSLLRETTVSKCDNVRALFDIAS